MASIYKGPDFTSTDKNSLNNIETIVEISSASWNSASNFLSSGSIRLGPNNNNNFYLTNSATVWDDIVVPLLTVNTGGANGAVIAAWGTNLRALQFNVTNQVNTWPSVQFPHGWLGTKVYPHIHWCSDAATTGQGVLWNLELTWAGIPGGLWTPSSTQTYTATAYSSGINVQIITDIPHEGIEPSTFAQYSSAISSIMVCRLYRSPANNLAEPDHDASTVKGISFDVHYEVDGLGSEDVLHKNYA